MNRNLLVIILLCMPVFIFVGCGKPANQTIDPTSDLFAERAAFQEEQNNAPVNNNE